MRGGIQRIILSFSLLKNKKRREEKRKEKASYSSSLISVSIQKGSPSSLIDVTQGPSHSPFSFVSIPVRIRDGLDSDGAILLPKKVKSCDDKS